MDKCFFMPVYHFFIPNFDGVIPRAYSNKLYRRCQKVQQLGFHFLREIGAFIYSSSTRRQLHGKGEASGKATVLAWFLSGEHLYNLRTCNWHSKPPSASN